MSKIAVVFLKDAFSYGYNGKPGETGTVMEPDVDYLLANGVIEIKEQPQHVPIMRKKFDRKNKKWVYGTS